MAIGGGLAVNRSAEVEPLNDPGRRQVEVAPDEAFDHLFVHVLGSEGLETDRNRIGHTDRISELHLEAVRKTRSNNIFGDITRCIRTRAVDFCRILARERTTAVASHSAIGIDDDFSPSEARVSKRPADDEVPGRIDVIFRVFVKVLGVDDHVNDVRANVRADLRLADPVVMLSGHHDRIHPNRLAFAVLDGYLGLSVRTQVGQSTGLADFGKTPA